MSLKFGLTVATLAFATRLLSADGFDIGVDSDWLDKNGSEEQTASASLKRLGIDSARIVISPKAGKAEALAKARRAKALGLEVTLDVRGEVDIREVLTSFKAAGVNPKWMAVDGGACKIGHETAKKTFPEMLVVVQAGSACNRSLADEKLKALADGGAKWDVIGLTLCPCRERPAGIAKEPTRIPDFDSRAIAKGIANCVTLARKWKRPTMIVETAFEAKPMAPMTAEYSRTMMERTLREAREHTEGLCRGICYAEPFELKDREYRAPKSGDLPTCGLCAHAGDTSAFPGNTVEGFASGLGKGAAMIEFDLKRCKSGEIVLNHDRTVKYRGKLTRVRELTLSQLKEIDLRGCRIPTLQEGLAVIPRNGVWINVHCGDLAEDVPLAEETMIFMKNDGRIRQAFLSAPTETIAAVRKKVPELIGNSMNYPKNSWKHLWTPSEVTEHFEIAMRNGCRFIQPHMSMLSKDDTAKFRANGGMVNYYVCNTALRLEPMLENGVDFALTDRLDEMCGRFRAIRRAWESAPKSEGATRLRMARNEKAEVAYFGKGDFGALRNADGVIFPGEAIATGGGKLRVRVGKDIPAGIYRGRGLVIHVNDFAIDEKAPAYVGATADRGNVEAYAKVLEASIAKVDPAKYPNWNWIPGARSVIDRVRAQGAGKFGFTDDPKEYDFWRNALAEVMDGNCRY